jgi:hypothetical protein
LGKVQRAVIEYLSTAPAGFDYPWEDPSRWQFVQHGRPYGVPIVSICRAVYGDYLTDPTPAQIRAVQRAVRRLEQLGHVDCWHGWHHDVERRYTNYHGDKCLTTRPVSALYAALRWDCEHLDRHHAEQKEREDEKTRRDAEFKALLSDNPLAALQSVFGGNRA